MEVVAEIPEYVIHKFVDEDCNFRNGNEVRETNPVTGSMTYPNIRFILSNVVTIAENDLTYTIYSTYSDVMVYLNNIYHRMEPNQLLCFYRVPLPGFEDGYPNLFKKYYTIISHSIEIPSVYVRPTPHVESIDVRPQSALEGITNLNPVRAQSGNYMDETSATATPIYPDIGGRKSKKSRKSKKMKNKKSRKSRRSKKRN